MGLKLHPYNPDKDLRTRVFNFKWRLALENKAEQDAPVPLTEKELAAKEKRRLLRQRWYYERGGKAIAAKNCRDRRARLKREGKL